MNVQTLHYIQPPLFNVMIADASITKPTYVRSSDLLKSNGIYKLSLDNLIKIIVGRTISAAANFKAVSHRPRE